MQRCRSLHFVAENGCCSTLVMRLMEHGNVCVNNCTFFIAKNAEKYVAAEYG